ncbi:MAG: DNA polymerase III subunit beta [Elusimicrobiaceae bacterium]|nr:DNA polymerase III subunit beta [Elusimicrobiaceae bacterium]
MKFQIDRNRLLQALERTRNAVMTYRESYYKSGWNEIFKCFIFKADCDLLTIETTNSEIYMSEAVSIGNKDGEVKAFAVNAGQLTKAIKSLDGQSLEFDVLEYQVIVRHTLGSFALPLIDGVEEYQARRKPQINYDHAQQMTVEAPGLRSILTRLNYAVAEDELRPVMNGVLIKTGSEYTDFVASDGHVLAKIRKASIRTKESASLVIPRRVLGILQKITPKTGFIEITFNPYDENWPTDSDVKQPAPVCQMNLDGVTITFRPIEGRYPNYGSVIPTTFSKQLTINRISLIKSLDRLSQFTGTSGLIRCELSQTIKETDTLKMAAEDKDFSLQATETLPCIYAGDTFKIGFQDFRLLRTLRNITSTDVVFNIVDQSRAVIITPAIQPDNEEVTLLIMPMLVND